MKEQIDNKHSKKIDQLQKDYSNTANELGIIEMQMLNLTDKKHELKDFYRKLTKTEKELLEELQTMYGDGNLNLQDKTFEKIDNE